MTLAEYQQAARLSLPRLCSLLGQKEGRVRGWIYQGRTPPLDVAHEIELRTDGHVRPVDWLPSELRNRVLVARGRG